MKKSVLLLSGGLDSTTTLYYALSKKYQVHCLIFDYGQRHRKEIQQAHRIAQRAQCPSAVVKIQLPWKGSSLIDKKIKIPRHENIDPKVIPSTYVPARNIIFLSFAVSLAESMGARVVLIGANAVDYSGYPDCRPEFFKAFEQVLAKGLKTGVEGQSIRIETPLIHKTKAEIIQLGMKLKVPYELTWSCYSGQKHPCGWCDSCRLRAKGFKDAAEYDPVLN